MTLPFNPFQFSDWQLPNFKPPVAKVRALIRAFQAYEAIYREVDRQRADLEAENDELRDRIARLEDAA